MKIAIPMLSFSAAGGMRVLSRLADTFIDQGHEVVFFASHLVNEPYYPTRAKVLKYRNPATGIPGLRGLFNLLGMFFFVLKNRQRYDVFLANFYVTAFPVCFAALGSGKAWYYIQAYEPEFFPGSMPGNRISRLLAGLSYFLPLKKIVNGGIYRRYKLLTCEAVVEPGIDLQTYVHQPHVIDEQRIIVGCIGRTLAWKGTLEIIEAVGHVREATGRNLSLRVAFELPDGLDISRFPYVERVQPHGDSALAAFYRTADVFVATGLLQDGAFHYPCLEAMASGCVVISNYSPATPDVAICVQNVNTSAIAQALMRYLDLQPEQRSALVQRAAEEVKTYAWPIIANKMMHYFKEQY